ncbi:MAG: zinc ABC transporter substrate-binding protein [Planctomycetota bacterium]|nr:zinc ABC transporter substrate-binding protein [Planctomycetota bacterium]
MRKVAVIATILLLTFAALSTVSAEDGARYNIMATFWPEKVFAENIVKGIDGFEVGIIIPASGTPHGFQISPKKLQEVGEADIVIANGYIEDFLNKLHERFPDIPLVRTAGHLMLMKSMSAQHDEHEEEEHEKEEEQGHDHGDYNPHTWLSVNNAIVEVRVIRDALVRLAPEKRSQLMRNAVAYEKKLHKLQMDMLDAAVEFNRTEIVTFHDAFGYTARDLGLHVLDVVMKVPGYSPSLKELGGLLEKIRKHNAAVFAEPQFPDRVVNLIAEKTGQKVYVLDPGVTTTPDADAYEKVMRANLKVLKEALK